MTRSSPESASDALDRIWDIVHTPTKATNHRSADRHFMADFDAIRQIIKDARSGGLAQTPAVTDEMVERAWAGIVGRDIADICHNASVVRGDIWAALVAALADTSTDRPAARFLCLCCEEVEVKKDGDECEFCRITYSVTSPDGNSK